MQLYIEIEERDVCDHCGTRRISIDIYLSMGDTKVRNLIETRFYHSKIDRKVDVSLLREKGLTLHVIN